MKYVFKIYSLSFILFFLLFSSKISAQTFYQKQVSTSRVKVAKKETDTSLKALFENKNLNYPPKEVFIRIFKEEFELELWTKNQDTKQYQLVKNFEVCSMSGELGAKRREGDSQVPEGFYYIDYYNPYSSYFLSVRINYPNKSDRILGYKPSLGNNICIHGDCVSIGCISITDPQIKELYWLLIQAKGQGQKNIPVHIFPNRLNKLNYSKLQTDFKDSPEKLALWQNLKQGYAYFENLRKLPQITVDKKGLYHFK